MLSNPPSHSRELIPLGDANKLQREDYAQILVLYRVRFIPKFAQILWQRSEMQVQETKTNFKAEFFAIIQNGKNNALNNSRKRLSMIGFIKNK